MMRMICVSDKDGNLILVVSVGKYGNADFGIAGMWCAVSSEVMVALLSLA